MESRTAENVIDFLKSYLKHLGLNVREHKSQYFKLMAYYVQANSLCKLGTPFFLEEPVARVLGIQYPSLAGMDEVSSTLGRTDFSRYPSMLELTNKEQDLVFWTIVEFLEKYPSTISFLASCVPWQELMREDKLTEDSTPHTITHEATKDYYEEFIGPNKDLLELITELRSKTTPSVVGYGADLHVNSLWDNLIDRYT